MECLLFKSRERERKEKFLSVVCHSLDSMKLKTKIFSTRLNIHNEFFLKISPRRKKRFKIELEKQLIRIDFVEFLQKKHQPNDFSFFLKVSPRYCSIDSTTEREKNCPSSLLFVISLNRIATQTKSRREKKKLMSTFLASIATTLT